MSRLSILAILLLIVTGCGEPSPKAKYDEALRDLDRAEAKLDSLRPAYDVARQTAANAVCKEIAGATVEESATAALAGLGEAMNPATAPPAADPAGDTKKAASGKKGDELDTTIDNLIAAQKDAQEKQATLTAPIAKANEVMKNIKTPGTPEAKQYEEKLAAMPEVKAYERQQRRVERAQQAVDEAKVAM